MKYAMAMVIAIALGAGGARAHSLKDVEDALFEREAYVQFLTRPAPPFTLDTARGGTVSLDDLAGKVVVLNFFYTNCPDVCPLQSAFLGDIQDNINRTAMRDAVQFVSISTDPARDTPAVLEDYAQNLGLDPVNWFFLTDSSGDPARSRAIAEAYGPRFTPGDDGYLLHGVVTHIIDKSGDLRARYHGLKVDPLNIILYINALTNDSH